ncbi:TolC family protein [Nitrosococcus oceani]|uniref:TolC family protein n=1 Tax=Nitrosococcus oceani TaxID=1229 RepID=UPI0004E8BA01|nr:TolC family protein [Nitrosococcus oceani]KFI23846.1 transporter [Nitrosococcus oceani]
MIPLGSSRFYKKPITYRFYKVLLVVLMVWLATPCFLAASETRSSPTQWLTIREAVRMGLSRPAIKQWVEGRISMAQSEAAQAALWSNPQLQYQREDAGGSIDQFLWLTQKFDFSGRRGLQVGAAQQRVRATRQDTRLRRLALVAKIRQDFYQALHQRELLGNLARWLGRLEVIEAVVQKREAAGVISGYDHLRLTREQAAVQARLQGEEATQQRIWEQLAAILGGQEQIIDYQGVTGALLPDPPPPLASLLQALTLRPDLQRLKRQMSAYSLERQAAARGWIPNLTLSLGSKRVTNTSTLRSDTGPFIVAGINLPLFDRNQAERDWAGARAQVARSEYQLALMEAQGAVRGRWREVQQLIATAQEVRRRDVNAARALVRTARAAYEGGEVGILELLDAYREEMNTVVRALALEQRARQAQIELERLMGKDWP